MFDVIGTFSRLPRFFPALSTRGYHQLCFGFELLKGFFVHISLQQFFCVYEPALDHVKHALNFVLLAVTLAFSLIVLTLKCA